MASSTPMARSASPPPSYGIYLAPYRPMEAAEVPSDLTLVLKEWVKNIAPDSEDDLCATTKCAASERVSMDLFWASLTWDPVYLLSLCFMLIPLLLNVSTTTTSYSAVPFALVCGLLVAMVYPTLVIVASHVALDSRVRRWVLVATQFKYVAAVILPLSTVVINHFTAAQMGAAPIMSPQLAFLLYGGTLPVIMNAVLTYFGKPTARNVVVLFLMHLHASVLVQATGGTASPFVPHLMLMPWFTALMVQTYAFRVASRVVMIGVWTCGALYGPAMENVLDPHHSSVIELANVLAVILTGGMLVVRRRYVTQLESIAQQYLQSARRECSTKSNLLADFTNRLGEALESMQSKVRSMRGDSVHKLLKRSDQLRSLILEAREWVFWRNSLFPRTTVCKCMQTMKQILEEADGRHAGARHAVVRVHYEPTAMQLLNAGVWPSNVLRILNKVKSMFTPVSTAGVSIDLRVHTDVKSHYEVPEELANAVFGGPVWQKQVSWVCIDVDVDMNEIDGLPLPNWVVDRDTSNATDLGLSQFLLDLEVKRLGGAITMWPRGRKQHNLSPERPVFRIEVPVFAQTPFERAEPQTDALQLTKDACILVVEKDRVSAHTLARYLRQLGFINIHIDCRSLTRSSGDSESGESPTSANASTQRTASREPHYALVIVPAQLPEDCVTASSRTGPSPNRGIDVAETFVQDMRADNIILVTAEDGRFVSHRAHAANIWRIIKKPYTLDDIRRWVQCVDAPDSSMCPVSPVDETSEGPDDLDPEASNEMDLADFTDTDVKWANLHQHASDMFNGVVFFLLVNIFMALMYPQQRCWLVLLVSTTFVIAGALWCKMAAAAHWGSHMIVALVFGFVESMGPMFGAWMTGGLVSPFLYAAFQHPIQRWFHQPTIGFNAFWSIAVLICLTAVTYLTPPMSCQCQLVGFQRQFFVAWLVWVMYQHTWTPLMAHAWSQRYCIARTTNAVADANRIAAVHNSLVRKVNHQVIHDIGTLPGHDDNPVVKDFVKSCKHILKHFKLDKYKVTLGDHTLTEAEENGHSCVSMVSVDEESEVDVDDGNDGDDSTIPCYHARILIVEDHAMQCKIYQHYLRQCEAQGMVVHMVADGPSAVELCRRATQAYTTILMDLNMKGMNGVETLRSIRALGGIHKHSKVYFITASPDDVGYVEGLRVTGVVRKPVDRCRVCGLIGSHNHD